MNRKKWKLGSALFLFVVITSAFTLARVKAEHKARRLAVYNAIIQEVQTGRLKADASGDILLPKHWQWLTKNGHVYQTYDKQAGLALLFPTAVASYKVDWGDGEITRLRDIAGEIYYAGSLPNDGWFTFQNMNDVCVWNKKDRLRPHWCYAEPFYSD